MEFLALDNLPYERFKQSQHPFFETDASDAKLTACLCFLPFGWGYTECNNLVDRDGGSQHVGTTETRTTTQPGAAMPVASARIDRYFPW